MKIKIYAEKIFLEKRELTDGFIVVEDDKIISVMEDDKTCSEETVIDLKNLTLAPGFIDTHVHGGDLADTMDLSIQSLDTIAKYKINEGVTSFCPTTVTATVEKTIEAVKMVKKAKDLGNPYAKIIGSFIEGMYINRTNKGAHEEKLIRNINLEEIEQIVNAGEGSISSFIIAPELEGALDAITYLKSKHINVKIGHSSATCEETHKAIEKGATVGVHIYNAMSPFNHREPGIVGAILTSDNIYGEIIADLIHVHPVAIKVLLKCKGPDKVILITDCMMAGGAADGDYKLGNLDVTVKDGVCRTESGALAGSTLKINDAVRNLVNFASVSPFDAVKMASQTPAKALGIFDYVGSVKQGKKADLVAFDDDFNIKFVMIDGKVVKNETV